MDAEILDQEKYPFFGDDLRMRSHQIVFIFPNGELQGSPKRTSHEGHIDDISRSNGAEQTPEADLSQ